MKRLIAKVRVYTKAQCKIDDAISVMLPSNYSVDEKTAYKIVGSFMHKYYDEIGIAYIALIEYRVVYYEEHDGEYDLL